MRLKILFAEAVLAAGLAGLAPPAQGQEPEPPPDVCLSVSDAGAPQTPQQVEIAHLYQELAQTAIGRFTLAEAQKKNVRACFDTSAADAPTASDGGISYGSYDAETGILRLNPQANVQETEKISTTLHELRHVRQQDAQQTVRVLGNAPAARRVAYEWLIEADARLAEIVLAHEKEQQGHGEYAAQLLTTEGAVMQTAFDRALDVRPGDLPGAMRAALLAFAAMPRTDAGYANAILDWIGENRLQFRPSRPANDLMSTDFLRHLGDMGEAGNYMDAATMEKVRCWFTGAQYRQLLRHRHEPGVYVNDGGLPLLIPQIKPQPAP